jgi:hypothetical protein
VVGVPSRERDYAASAPSRGRWAAETACFTSLGAIECVVFDRYAALLALAVATGATRHSRLATTVYPQGRRRALEKLLPLEKLPPSPAASPPGAALLQSGFSLYVSGLRQICAAPCCPPLGWYGFCSG